MDHELILVTFRLFFENNLSGSIPSVLGKLSLLDYLYDVFVFDLLVT